MKKTFLLSAMLLAMAGGMQADNKLTADDVTLAYGEPAELIISMENDIEVGAYDFHLYLPEGIAVVYDEEEDDYVYELSNRHNKKHQLTIKYDTTDDSFMFGVADPSLHKIKDHNGEIMRVQLVATAVAAGNYQGSIKKIWFAESGSSGADVADTTFKIEVVGTGVGIRDVTDDGGSARYFTLTGLRVAKPSKGVYIVNGKKRVKK